MCEFARKTPMQHDDRWPAWRPISEAPRDGTHILLWQGGCDPACVVGYWDEDDELPSWRDYQHCILDFMDEPITHWLPIPQAPEGGDGS